MYSKAVTLCAVVALVEARFGQEQLPVAAIQAVTSGGGPGVAATLAGGSISTILAAANSCDKLSFADKIIAQLGTGADSVKAAQGLVAAEKNFNPFAASIPTICSDPALPSTAILRGITPLIDPAVVGSDVANKLSAQSLTTPFQADGISVADVLIANGFTNFTKQASATGGSNGAASVGTSTGSNSSSSTSSTGSAGSTNSTSSTGSTGAPNSTSSCVIPPPPPPPCGGTPTTFATVATAAATTAAAAASSAVSASGSGVQQSSIPSLDFGKCIPTIAFEGGLGGRPATEMTFQIIDPIARGGQQEALNPNIISNALCNQLINVCGVAKNSAAETACLSAKAAMSAAGTRDASTANNWNTMLGFAGVDITPSADTL